MRDTRSRTGWDGADEATLVGAAPRMPEAFTELYRRHVERVHAFAWRRCRHRETAEDVVAATFEKAWRRLGQFDPGRGRFVNWILGIAAHELADRHRAATQDARDRTVAATVALSESTVPAPDELAVAAADGLVLQALDRLSPRYQSVLMLRHLEGLPAAEVAAALGESPSVLAVTTHRARRALRRELARLEGTALAERREDR